MAERRPLVLVSGRQKELPTADTFSWALLSSKPTTVTGYGITDAVTTSGAQTIAGTKTLTSAAVLAHDTHVNGAAGAARRFGFRTAGVLRWDMGADGGAESGSNAGSNFVLQRFSDAGALIDSPLSITRSTGRVVFASAPQGVTPIEAENSTLIPTTAWVRAYYARLSAGGTFGADIAAPGVHSRRGTTNKGIELAADPTNQFAFLDFHTNNTNFLDTDARIYASGSAADNTSNYGATIGYQAASHSFLGAVSCNNSVSGTSGLFNRGGAAADTVTSLRAGAGGYFVNFYPRLGAASYNPLVQTGDSAIIYDAGGSGTGALVIGQWSAVSKGLRIATDGAITVSHALTANGAITSTGLLTASAALTVTTGNLTLAAAGTEFFRAAANSATTTRQPRVFIQSTDPDAAAADGDLWGW